MPVGVFPIGIAVTQDGKRVYVANSYWWSLGGNTVSVIDTATNNVTTVKVRGPYGVAVDPAGTKVYVTSQNNNVHVIDTATNTVIATVPVGVDPKGIAVTQDGKNIYVANSGSNTISVIDTANNTVTATVGESPIAIGQFIG
jgi:YVTN family beta-propeller protein